jgi:peptidoglycan/LPS O-acetylase OafA/YrhL
VSSRINPVMWSLIIEAHFYATLPVLFLIMRRLKGLTSVVALSGVLLVVPALLRWWNMAHGHYFELHPVIRVNFPSQLDCFAFGVFLAGIENLQLGRKAWAKLGDIGLALLAASMAATAWFDIHPIAQPEWQQEVIRWEVEISSALLLCYVFDPAHPRTRLFSTPWLRWCGIVSYEWYLFHQPLTLWGRQWLGPSHGSLAKYALIVGGSFVISALIAAVIYRFYSLPILKFGRGAKAN